MGNGNYAAERELCFKLELCAVMALVWDVRGYLLGCLVWDSYQVLAECQISLGSIEIGSAFSVEYIEAHIKHTYCFFHQILMQLFDHLKGDF